MGIFSIVETKQTPIEKVHNAVQSVVYNEIRKQRNSTLRDNIVNQPTFIGISEKNAIIDEEDETKTGIDNRYMAQVEYPEAVGEEDETKDLNAQPMIMLDSEWVEHLNHAQLTEFLEHVLGEKLTEDSSGEFEIINEDWTDYEQLSYSISSSPVSEIEAAITKAADTDESCDTGEIAEGMSESKTSDDEPERESAKTTEDTRATFTRLKGEMSGNIDGFISGSPRKMSEGDISRIQEVQDILEDGMRFLGTGKAKTISPSKRLNMRAVITESSENEYIGRKQGGGKKVKIMLTIDRSGSMHGQPTTESNVLMSALNNIVLSNPELEVEVMLSYTGAFTKFKLPVGGQFSKEIWALSQTGDAEYLWQNMSDNLDSLIDADINLVYTDGSICDDPIDKIKLERRDVHITGLYVSDAMGVDNIKNHYKRNKMYFHHVVVRPSIMELAEEISNKIFSERSMR